MLACGDDLTLRLVALTSGVVETLRTVAMTPLAVDRRGKIPTSGSDRVAGFRVADVQEPQRWPLSSSGGASIAEPSAGAAVDASDGAASALVAVPFPKIELR